MRWCPWTVFVFGSACVTLTQEGARISVYRAPLDAAPARRSMPQGCRLVATKPKISMPEVDMEGLREPYRGERNQAAADGANVLLVLSRQVVSRRDPECPAA